MKRTIRVTGKGNLSVKPDTIRLVMTLEGMQQEYDKAIQLSAEMTEQMKTMFEKLGFSRDEIKTLYFNVDAKFEIYQTKDKGWKRRFEGYEFTQRIKVQFPVDNLRMGKILYELGHCPFHPEFRIEYTVADPEKCKNDLLANAVKDSAKKAQILTEAAGVSLEDIVTIDYSWGEIEFVSRPIEHMVLEDCCHGSSMDECENRYDIDIDPDDIKVSDHVTVVWTIR